MEDERIVVVFEEHRAQHTSANSEWEFTPEPLVSPVYVGGKAHKKYLTIVKKGTIAILVRQTNRGNVRITKVRVDKPMFLDYLGFTGELPEEYIELAKKLNLI